MKVERMCVCFSFLMQSIPFFHVEFLKICTKYSLNQVENSHKSSLCEHCGSLPKWNINE